VQSEIEKELRSRILYQSSCCVVVNKLKGETVEGALNKIVNLQNELKKNLPPSTEIVEAVNRLDVPVTGCALFALTKESLSFLNAAFTQEKSSTKGINPLFLHSLDHARASTLTVSLCSSIEKIYWAIVEKPKSYQSENPNSSKELVHWIEINSKKNKSFAHNKETPGCKKASLDYKIKSEGKNYLFVEINLHSGRHHQIRAQFAAAGLFIKGDLKYGAKRSEKEGGIRLHARSLSFPDPSKTTEKITVTAEPPQMDNLWEIFLPL
jgi:23S rRNA pseudouridine1911/1915/1917 synthase